MGRLDELMFEERPSKGDLSNVSVHVHRAHAYFFSVQPCLRHHPCAESLRMKMKLYWKCYSGLRLAPGIQDRNKDLSKGSVFQNE